jgi:hypothetical protein
MEYSGDGGKLIHEKNQKQKISWHCPFKGGTNKIGLMIAMNRILILAELWIQIYWIRIRIEDFKWIRIRIRLNLDVWENRGTGTKV